MIRGMVGNGNRVLWRELNYHSLPIVSPKVPPVGTLEMCDSD